MHNSWPFLSPSEVPRNGSLTANPLMKAMSSLVGCFSSLPSHFSAMLDLAQNWLESWFYSSLLQVTLPTSCHIGSLKLAMAGLFIPIHTTEIGKCYKLVFPFYFSKNRSISTSLQVVFWNGFLLKMSPSWSPFVKSRSGYKNHTLDEPSMKI